MKDKTFTFRINNDLLDSLSRHCEIHEISKSGFIVRAIKKALENEGIESPKSPAPSPSGGLDTNMNQDEIKAFIGTTINETFETFIDEMIEEKLEKLNLQEGITNAIIANEIKPLKDEINQRFENLETQSNQEVKPLEVETEKAHSQLSIIQELPHETQEADSPTELTLGIEVSDSVFNILTPDQQSVILAIVEGKSENEIKSLIPVTGNKLYLQGLAKSLGFKNVTSMGINKLIPLMKNCLIIANK